jgi:hypothetical protein
LHQVGLKLTCWFWRRFSKVCYISPLRKALAFYDQILMLLCLVKIGPVDTCTWGSY